jgi:hypothetical protein
LTGIHADDSSGSLVSNITITAESGTVDPLSPVPEPASFARMLAAASRSRGAWAAATKARVPALRFARRRQAR